MRRSRSVAAPLLASAAVALLAGCHSQEMQRCVDQNNRVVDPKFCQNPPRCVDRNGHTVDAKVCQNLAQGVAAGPNGEHWVGADGQALPMTGAANNSGSTGGYYGGYHGGYGGGFLYPYHYYYGGSGSVTPGSIATGGSTAPVAGHAYSTTARGGFGSSFSSHGAGGEGGGHGGGAGE